MLGESKSSRDEQRLLVTWHGMRANGGNPCSIWVFLLLGIEAIRTYRVNPTFHVGSYAQVPTWTTPLVLALLTTFLVPNASFLGHLCGLAVGYLCK